MSIRENIENIEKSIPSNVKLLAVSKTRNIEEMEEAYDTGIRDFAENKVQELMRKEESFHKDVRWHLIGKLQTNKVKYIVGKVHLIHSLSSIKLLEKIEELYGKENLIANTLIQINIGREESKSGVLLEDLEELIVKVEECNHVKVKGIMVIIPKGDEESNRYYFKETNKIFLDLQKRKFKNINMKILSMGMTHDYKIAIEEGSNMVRIGTGIFGERNYNI
ncbi:pyridoxal phosphate enzyme (YggS family) [Clostridium moniliforme]|uniref:Pyridoxal phosphate homeostasis protein n=1 Tax=Clostridium moniliforme TaxID=39489 RepID=A0ABS4F0F0_9CLOT|nr:YggS family pyridoxal phosphate-dependent enzyme [Clostridium moniliforme]MBP1889728.1 pyridoxal phosphate enzyme (YggS family) [Clostridium moniliforme]